MPDPSPRRWRAGFGVPLLGAALLVLTGCSNFAQSPPCANILMAQKQGGPIDPQSYRRLKTPEYDAYIDDMFEGLADFCQHKEPCKLLLFFHGGLNTRKGAVQRATDLTDRIEQESNSYPIFINWRSSLFSSWWDHVAHVHKGIWTGGKTTFLAPYFIAVDEVKSIAEAPVAWVAEGRHIRTPEEAAGSGALTTYRQMVQGYPPIDVNNLLNTDLTKHPERVLEDNRSGPDRWVPRGTLALTWWSKLLTPPLLIQAGGTGAWSVLERRTAMLFRTEAEFRGVRQSVVASERSPAGAGTSQEAPPPPATTGPQALAEQKARKIASDYDTGAALGHFLDRFQKDFLRQFCKEGRYTRPSSYSQERLLESPDTEPCEHPVEITLVGHSMGTIIINRLLRYAPDLEVKNIVFMGAATTVEDYRSTIIPYLLRHQKKGAETQMYHLVLHPLAEVTERNYFDLAPWGSLLTWIDNYFTDPPSPLGRRVGRFANLIPELAFTPKDVQPQIHLKVFRVASDLRCWSPQKHGDFGSFPFWDERFWRTSIESDKTSPIRRLDGQGCPAEARR